jgi:hypothetical protein
VAGAGGSESEEEPGGSDVGPNTDPGEGLPQRLDMERLVEEPAALHRAFLLFAMQDPDLRSLRAAAKGVEKSEGALRNWRTRWRWDERMQAEANGAAAQARALQLYRDHYAYHHRGRDVASVAHRMSAPLLPAAEPPPKVTVRGVTGGASEREPDAGQAASPLGDLPQTKALTSRQLQVLQLAEKGWDHLMVEFWRSVKAGNVKIGPREALLISREQSRLRQEIDFLSATGAPAPTTAQGSNGSAPAPLEPTHRVREAERLGRSVTSALLEDAEELVGILRTIVTAEAVDAGWSSPTSQSARAADAAKDADDGAAPAEATLKAEELT